MKYEKINHDIYKYRITEDYKILLDDFHHKSFTNTFYEWVNNTSVYISNDLNIKKFKAGASFDNSHILTIKTGYAWDGASGIAIDSENFMEASLVHDAFYQFMREKIIPITYKDYADRLLQKICIKNGMSKFRAGYVYWAVKWFGGKYAK